MINKTLKQNMVSGLGILAILTFGMTITPIRAEAQTTYYDYNNPRIERVQNYNQAPVNNPTPVVNSISPNSSNLGVGVKTVTITGSGFVPSSVARINGTNRPVTFIDSSHLLVQVTGSDTYAYRANGGFFISIFNRAPGGGYSNAIFFTINDAGGTADTNNNDNSIYGTTDNSANNSFSDSDTTQAENSPENEETVSSLASNVVFGSNTLYPSGLTQWVFFAILVLLAVIIARRIFGADKKYHETPLKHA